MLSYRQVSESASAGFTAAATAGNKARGEKGREVGVVEDLRVEGVVCSLFCRPTVF